MAPLPITLAAGPYDRARALADGRVTVRGADLRYLTLDPEEIFFRMVTHGELARSAALAISLPFVREEYQRTAAPTGADFWSYGIEPNGPVLTAFGRPAAAQHLIAEPPPRVPVRPGNPRQVIV